MKRERDPTTEELQQLLAWLESAGLKYETIHFRLIRFFIFRRCVDAETLADEVMNRVAVRIEKVVETYKYPIHCFLGFAEKVYREYLRDRLRQSDIEPPVPSPPNNKSELERKEKEDACLTRCMEELSLAEANLFRRYFQYEKSAKIRARKKLAVELRLTANALRIKAHRIRRRLRQCMVDCLAEIV
jgi:RNA polymerase sigma factor (sigma-70 family)